MASGRKRGAPWRPAVRARRRRFAAVFRNNFLTGLVVVAPVVLTLYIIWGIITFVDSRIVPWVPSVYNPSTYVDYEVPGFGLFVFVILTTVVGYFTRNLFGRQIVRTVESWVDRMPIVRTIYNALKQIVETILSQSATSFQKACLIEYPRKGMWSLAFIAAQTTGEVPLRAGGRKLVSVFMPTTPNPTTGFLMFVPAEDIVILDMTIEDAAKMIISAGLVIPPTEGNSGETGNQGRRRELAASAAARGGIG